MKVVSNASPLINLSIIGELSILKCLYGRIIIPGAVYQEVVVDGVGKAGALDVAEAGWIERAEVGNQQEVKMLRFDLDAGEAESIVLALEHDADLLLMDERIGREISDYMGLTYTGTVGLLIEAKRNGHIEYIRPVLEKLRDKAGFYISDSLWVHVLAIAHEPE